MLGNLTLFITACTDKGVTRYKCWGGKSCISISVDHGQYVVGTSGSELGPSGQERHQSGKDLGEVEVSEWWKVAADRGCLRDGG